MKTMSALGRYALAATLMLTAALAADTSKNPPAPQTPALTDTDAAIAKAVRHEVLTYPYYSIWDDVSMRIQNGQVQLLGAVSQPFKKHDIENMVKRVKGVEAVDDQLEVLPLSPNDDRLRLQVARAIYGDSAFIRYRFMALPPIHIIVDNGHVKLTGVVLNDFEKQMAGMRASSAGMSFGPVINDLQVENPSKKS